jgi:hypothetical protein
LFSIAQCCLILALNCAASPRKEEI